MTAIALAPIRPLRFGTLAEVEVRKATDTRSGRGLLLGIVAVSLVVLGWKLAHPSSTAQTFDGYAQGVATVVTFLAPLVGILAMTSEWTQRTVLTTFTLAPRRGTVLAAKAASSMALALVALATTLVLAALALLVSAQVHGAVEWGSPLEVIRGSVLQVALAVVMGLAFGALAGSTPVGLAAHFIAPTVWGMVSVELLGDAARWFDVFWAFDRVSSPDPFAHLGETLTSVAIWVVLPAALGALRWLRREVA